jgi:RimJ/RimL family protein N-acetyltransferase
VQTDAQALAFIEEMSNAVLFPSGRWVQLAVAEPEANRLIGDIGVCVAADGASAELGFTISPRFQGQGLGTEALREAIGLVFERSSAVRAICVTDARNTRSIHLLERAKMRRTATAEAVFRGEPCIEHTYAVFRHDGA